MNNRTITSLILSMILLISCSKTVDEQIAIAKENAAKGNYEKSVEKYEKALKNIETDEQGLEIEMALGSIYQENLNNPSKAKFHYASVINYAEYLDASTLREMAKKNTSIENYDAAGRAYDLWLSKHGKTDLGASMAYERAELYHKHIRDLNKAAEAYKKVYNEYANSPFGPKAAFSLGYMYANELNDMVKAAEEYTKFLKNYPDNEMVPSVEFEMKYLGKTLEEIPELQHLMSKQS